MFFGRPNLKLLEYNQMQRNASCCQAAYNIRSGKLPSRGRILEWESMDPILMPLSLSDLSFIWCNKSFLIYQSRLAWTHKYEISRKISADPNLSTTAMSKHTVWVYQLNPNSLTLGLELFTASRGGSTIVHGTLSSWCLAYSKLLCLETEIQA